MTELAATGIGETLARARQRRGLALGDAAQMLKFAPRQLEALEQERFEVLPGGAFARGMVRSYARLLNVDPEPLLATIAHRFEAPDSDELAARFRQPVPFSNSTRRSTIVYIGLSIGVLGLVGMLAYGWHHERAGKPLASAEAEARAPGRTPPELSRVPIAAEPASVAAATDVPSIEPQAPAEKEEIAPVRSADSTGIAPAKIPLATSSGGQRIVLRCEQEAWIEIKDAADRVLVSSLNPAGTERVVQGRPPFTLVIGNAQHVRLSYNDRPVELAPHIKVEVARFTLQ